METEITPELKSIQKKNCWKHLILTMIFNPILILLLWIYLSLIISYGYYNIPWLNNVFFISLITTILIISTILIPLKLFKLRKKLLIWKICFIIIFIIRIN